MDDPLLCAADAIQTRMFGKSNASADSETFAAALKELCCLYRAADFPTNLASRVEQLEPHISEAESALSSALARLCASDVTASVAASVGLPADFVFDAESLHIPSATELLADVSLSSSMGHLCGAMPAAAALRDTVVRVPAAATQSTLSTGDRTPAPVSTGGGIAMDSDTASDGNDEGCCTATLAFAGTARGRLCFGVLDPVAAVAAAAIDRRCRASATAMFTAATDAAFRFDTRWPSTMTALSSSSARSAGSVTAAVAAASSSVAAAAAAVN